MSAKLRNHQRLARLPRERIIQLLNEHPLTAIDGSDNGRKLEPVRATAAPVEENVDSPFPFPDEAL